MTFVILGTVVYIGNTPHCVKTLMDEELCVSKFKHFMSSTPNEIGDTLAGIAGSLAFLWIIITVLIQSQELKAQRQELGAHRSELALNRIESKKMVQAMEQQTKIFEDEKIRRDESQMRAVLNEKIKLLTALVIQISSFYRSSYCDVNMIAPSEDDEKNEIRFFDAYFDFLSMFPDYRDLDDVIANDHVDDEIPLSKIFKTGVVATEILELIPLLNLSDVQRVKNLNMEFVSSNALEIRDAIVTGRKKRRAVPQS